jgi:hypothetical protein
LEYQSVLITESGGGRDEVINECIAQATEFAVCFATIFVEAIVGSNEVKVEER